jgi:hypothetical protein
MNDTCGFGDLSPFSYRSLEDVFLLDCIFRSFKSIVFHYDNLVAAIHQNQQQKVLIGDNQQLRCVVDGGLLTSCIFVKEKI